ncbi:homing endonuclease associated repeat-containing protein [Halorubrum distributum]|nr:PQQ-binding-like beta-propeller repeat protein [Halorubrum distributum]
MDQYDAANTGYAPNERGPRSNPRELWRSDAGDALIGSAAVVDSVTYTADETGTVRALDAVTGMEQWAVDLDEEIVTSPVIAGEMVCVTTGESLHALDVSDGAERWVETIGADPSSPIVTDGVIFVAGGNTVHAFALDGTAATAVDLTGEIVSTPAVDGSTLYAATDAGTVYAFDVERSTSSVTLTERWTTSTVIDRRPTVTVSGGILVVTGASPGEGEQGRVYALSADTGEDQWAFSTTRWIESGAAIDDDTVYVGGDNGDVVALAAESGAERWRFNANDSWSFLYWGPGVSGGLVVTDDTVYVGSEDYNLYAIDADTGAPQWRFPTSDAIVSTPTVVDGIAFVGSTDGALYSITSPEASPVPLDGGAGGAGVETDFDDSNTGDGGVLGFSLPNGLSGLVTSPVTLLVLAIGLLYGIASIALNDSDGNDTASTGSAAEAQSTPAIYRGSASSITVESDTESGTPVESAGSVASGAADEVRGESPDDRGDGSQRTELLDELRELDRKWSEIDRTLLYSVGNHHPDEYEDIFGSLDAALAVAGVHDPDDSATPSNETDSDPADTTSSTSTRDTDEAAETTETSSETPNSQTRTKKTTTGMPSREALINELQALAEDWDTIDRKLLYSVGNHHPDEYEDVFGSFDAALVAADIADPDTATAVTADKSSPFDEHDELITELQELAEDWDTIDRKLLYSVGDYHPDEYDDAFGSVDAALFEAGLTDTDTTDDDTAAETAENSTDTRPASTTGKQPQSVDSSTMTDLHSNELAELYVAFDRFQHLLTELAGELDTDGTAPMEQWADAVADHWGSGGPAGAPNYGVQQRDRNDFSIRDYRDAHGDGERVTDFHHVEFAPADDRIQHLLGDAIDDWDHAVPVAPDSNTPLPVAIASTEALDTAIELLDEFPAYPDADRPAPDDTDVSPDSPTLPDGRVDTLTVTVLNHDPNPGSKRDARLQVALTDGTEVPLDIWSTHDLSLDWSVGETYTIEQARHKSWETSTGTGHQLSSTKDFRVMPTDAGSAGNTPDINPPSRSSADTSSTSGRSRDTSTSSGKSASNSGRSRTRSSGTPSRGDLLDAMQHVGETIDRPLKASDVSDTTAYSVNDITRVFGSWQNALDSAGIDNKARLIDDLHRVADTLGHRPTTTEMNEHGHVSATTYATYFGTYTAAVEQAFDEAEATRSPTGTDTADQADATKTGSGASTARSGGTTARDTGDSDQATSGDESTGTTPDDDGILGDIMNDFDEFSDSEAE